MSNFTISPRDGNYVVDRLTNYANTAEGTLLPPLQRGAFRVPFASGFQVIRTVNTATTSTFTLVWNNIARESTTKVDHYNIYCTINNSTTPQQVGSVTAIHSPAQITIPLVTRVAVTFYLQAVLSNGMSADLASSPTTTSYAG